MKKVFLGIIAVLMFGFINAQSGIGVNGGLLIGMAKAESGGNSATNSETGFYAGVFKEFDLGSESLKLQPALNAIVIDDSFGIQIPVIFKYYVADGFNIQGGPQLVFDFEETPDDFTNLNLGLALGAGYDFSEKFSGEVRYGLQLNNYYTGDADLTAKMNTLNIGVGYKF